MHQDSLLDQGQVQSDSVNSGNQSLNDSENPGIVIAKSDFEKSSEFRDTTWMYQTLISAREKQECGEWTIHDTIPMGVKENVMFLVNHQNQSRKRYKHPKCDQGAFLPPTSVKVVFKTEHDSNQLTYLGVDGDIDEEALGLTKDNKVVIKTMYYKLKAEPTYHKKIFYVIECPDKFAHAKSICAVEYIGSNSFGGSNPIPHKSSIKNTNPYTASNPDILDAAVADIRNGMSDKDIFLKYKNIRNPQKSIKTTKTIRNLRYNLPENKAMHSANFADELFHVETMKAVEKVKDKHSQFVQFSSYDKGRNATVILHKQWMINDFVRNCAIDEESGLPISVVSLDRTFSVGKAFETAVTYQNQSVRRIDTQTHPIMPALISYHQKSDFRTYQKILNHLKTEVEEVEPKGPKKFYFVTDGETALINAVKSVFPDSTHMLCQRHLRENVKNKLKGVQDQDDIVFRMFDSKYGLSASSSIDEFNNRLKKVDIEKFPDTDYAIKMTETILDDVVMPRLKSNGIVAVNQTTNVSESFNHQVKSYNGWLPHQLPVLCFRSENLVDSNEVKLCSAIYGDSEFELMPHVENLKVPIAAWSNKSETWQIKRFNQLTKPPPRSSSVSTFDRATNGTLSVAKGSLMKKPNGTSAKADRTRSTPKRSQSTPGRGRALSNANTPKSRPRAQDPSTPSTPRPRGRPPGSKNKSKKQRVEINEDPIVIAPNQDANVLDQIQDTNKLEQSKDSIDSNDPLTAESKHAKRRAFFNDISSDSDISGSPSPSKAGPTRKGTKPEAKRRRCKSADSVESSDEDIPPYLRKLMKTAR